MTVPRAGTLLAAVLLLAGCRAEDHGGGRGAVVRIHGDTSSLEREDLPPFEAATGRAPTLTLVAEGATVSLTGREGTGIVIRASRFAADREDLPRVRIETVRKGEDEFEVRQTVQGSPAAEERLQAAFTIEAPRGVRVSIRNRAGSVTLAAVDGGAAVRSGGGAIRVADAGGALDLETAAGSVTLEGARKGARVRTGGGTVGVEDAAGELDLETAAGSVKVPRASGPTRVRTGGGRVEVREAGGALDLESAAGSIAVEGAAGPVRAHTGGGGIRLAGARGDLDLESAAGSIRAEGVDGRIEAETGGGSIHIAGSPRGDSSARSAAGSVEVSLAAACALRVEARTAVGALEGPDGPVRDGRRPAREASWTLGDGSGGTLRVETGGGSVRVRRE